MVGKGPLALVENDIWAGGEWTQRIGALLDENESRQNDLEFMGIISIFILFVYGIFLFSLLQSWMIETTSTNNKCTISNLQDCQPLTKGPWAPSPSSGRSWGKGCKELKYLLYGTLCVSHAILQSKIFRQEHCIYYSDLSKKNITTQDHG